MNYELKPWCGEKADKQGCKYNSRRLQNIIGRSETHSLKYISYAQMGREDIEVRLKDNAAVNWCSIATELTGTTWNYVKVLQNEYEGLHPSSFEEIINGLNPPTLFDGL